MYAMFYLKNAFKKKKCFSIVNLLYNKPLAIKMNSLFSFDEC